MNWLAEAQALPVGGSKKIGHDCGEGRCLVVFNNPDKWSAYCHRCGAQPPVFKPLPTLAERVAAKAAAERVDDAIEGDPSPPMPAVFDLSLWPPQARLWLFKAGLDYLEISQLGAYYHEASRRVVLPVLEDGRVTFWQARRVFDGPGAKYLSMPGGRERCVPVFGTGPGLVLTEDLLSAYKISTAGHRALCLMGTKLLDVTLAYLLKGDERIVLWLDPDKAGQDAAADITRTLSLFGKRCENIVSLKDPKLHSKAEIRAALTLDPTTHKGHEDAQTQT